MKDEQQQPDVKALVRGHLDDEQRPRIGVSPSCSTSSMLADGDALVADKLPGSARNQSCPRVAAATPGHHSGHAPPSGVMPPGHPLTARPAEARKPTRDTEATPSGAMAILESLPLGRRATHQLPYLEVLLLQRGWRPMSLSPRERERRVTIGLVAISPVILAPST